MRVQCGQCYREVSVPDTGRRVGFCVCGCAVAPFGTPLSEIQAELRDRGGVVHPDAALRISQQMREWDASAAFGRLSEDATRDEFYASWSAYDAALLGMSPMQQDLQRKAEILALHQMASR